MYYYEVFVAEQRYQKQEPLTYSWQEKLLPGTIVRVPYGNRVIGGFVHRVVPKPSFKTKPIEIVVASTPLPLEVRQLHTWMLDYYPGGGGATTQLFIPSTIKPRELKKLPPALDSTSLPPLTDEQKRIIEEITKSRRTSFLLHGETGSGKTRVYAERAKQAIKHGKSAIILTPEISLVPQLVAVFGAALGVSIIEFHSGLTSATRLKNWLQILNAKEPLVVIGTRSALFVPLNSVGFIAVDEMHEPAYKQESAPRYYALRAAAKRAQLQSAEIIYGSATPPITEYFLATETGVPILRLTKTAKSAEKPRGIIVDMKDTSAFTRHRQLSNLLLSEIESRLKSNEQSLIFLNRRGTARQIVCQSCGWQALCPKCDLPLTLHADTHELRCHTCGYHSPPPYSCPNCQSGDIVYRSPGTKAIVEDLNKLFPEARIQRFDTDNTAGETLTHHFAAIHSGEIDILVGTQMLGKGLDLPRLSLVGIVNADTALHMPDFSSAERGYQLLHQAIGRVGRGHTSGHVVIQTFQPDDTLLGAAISHDWPTLYEHELAERKRFMFPPFCYLLKISVSRRSNTSAESFISKLATSIRAQKRKVEVEDPSPAFHERSHGNHNWQLIVKARDRRELTRLVQALPPGDYTYDLDPINLL